MGWTNPRTWTGGELVTAALMNVHVRDNLVDLDARALGVFSADPATHSSPPLTGYQVIATYPIPALTLDATGKTVHFQAAGYFAANGNYKVALLRVGGVDQAFIGGNINNVAWHLDVKVTRRASNTQLIASWGIATGVTHAICSLGASADAAIIPIDVVSWSDVGAASDVVLLGSWAQVLG
jgi:hypothetical protein